jgi:hypothetical protein
VQGEVSRAELLSRGIKVEVERVDCVDLGEARVAEAAVHGALDAALLLLVERRCRTSRLDRLSLAARSRSEATSFVMPGSLSHRSFWTSRSTSSPGPPPSFFFMRAPRSREVGPLDRASWQRGEPVVDG